MIPVRGPFVLVAALACVALGAAAAPSRALLPAPAPASARPTVEIGTLLRAGMLFRSLKLCGGAPAPADKQVLGDILLAASVVPDLSMPLPADARVLADIRAPSKALRERMQTQINIYGELVSTLQTKFATEGRASVCTPDLVPRIKAFADSARASGIAANADHVSTLMVANQCPGLGVCN